VAEREFDLVLGCDAPGTEAAGSSQPGGGPGRAEEAAAIESRKVPGHHALLSHRWWPIDNSVISFTRMLPYAISVPESSQEA
jgi:hypothetical protein